jgi:hypothetical protein
VDQTLRADAARRFGQSADSLVESCRVLEQMGLEANLTDDLYQTLERVTKRVHQMHPPEERVQWEPADVAVSACRIASHGTAPTSDRQR